MYPCPQPRVPEDQPATMARLDPPCNLNLTQPMGGFQSQLTLTAAAMRQEFGYGSQAHCEECFRTSPCLLQPWPLVPRNISCCTLASRAGRPPGTLPEFTGFSHGAPQIPGAIRHFSARVAVDLGWDLRRDDCQCQLRGMAPRIWGTSGGRLCCCMSTPASYYQMLTPHCQTVCTNIR